MMLLKQPGYDLRDQLRSQKLILLVSMLSFIGLLFVSLLKSSFTPLDSNVNYWVTSIQTSSFTPIAETIDFAFDTPVVLTITVLSATFLFYKDHRKKSTLLVGAMSGNAIMLEIIKRTVHSARPLN